MVELDRKPFKASGVWDRDVTLITEVVGVLLRWRPFFKVLLLEKSASRRKVVTPSEDKVRVVVLTPNNV